MPPEMGSAVLVDVVDSERGGVGVTAITSPEFARR